MADEGSENGRLDSWKEIALYVGRDVRTVIRWEKQKGLPVHRIPGGQRKAVFAYPHEIDHWRNHGNSTDGNTGEALSAEQRSVTDEMPRREMVESRTGFFPFATPSAGSRSKWLTGMVALVSVIVICGLLVAFALWHSPPDLVVANPTRITQSQTRILSPLLSDGVRVYYPQLEDSRYSVAAVPAKGGQGTTVVTSVANPELCDMAQGSHAMLLRSLNHSRDAVAPVYIQPQAGLAQRVGNILAYDAAWYPDGKRILYSTDGVVYSSDTAGESPQKLFSVPGNAYWFKWAPDGRTLRFSVINPKTEDTSIWEASEDGRNLHRLFAQLPFRQCCGTWTPDGKYYLFQAWIGDAFQIWAQRERPRFLFSMTNRPFRLVAGAMNYRGPLVSRDGGKLFLRTEDIKGELVQYDRNLGRFVPMLPGIPARTLAFSKDAKWIAYTSLANNELWRCHADGTDCLQLTQGFRQTMMPRWSPDGRMVAFVGRVSGAWRIYVVPADGGTVRLLSNGDQSDDDPDWSPDGKKLVFGEAWTASALGGIHLLDVQTDKVSSVPESDGYFSPRWSPDGRFLVALHAGDQYLSLFDFGSGKWQRLTEMPAIYPNWSQDGKYVYFSSSSAGSRAIFRVALADRTVEKIASLAGVEQGPFFMSNWVGFAPDDTPLAVNDLTSEDIYAWDVIAR